MQVVLQQAREIGGIEVVLDIEHQSAVHAADPADLIDAGQRRQLQQAADLRRGQHLPRRYYLGRRHPPLGFHHRMEMGPRQRVVGQARWGDEPAAAFLAIDQPQGLQLQQGFAQGDAGGGEEFAQLALGRQALHGRQQPMGDLLLQGLADGAGTWRTSLD